MYLHWPKSKLGRRHYFILDGAGILLHFYEISPKDPFGVHVTFGDDSLQLLQQMP